jgi:hypothetical protein
VAALAAVRCSLWRELGITNVATNKQLGSWDEIDYISR